MAVFSNAQAAFPRVRDNLAIIDYPSLGNVTFVQVDYIETSEYEYQSSASVKSTAPSVYTSNQMNALIPNAGHLNMVVPAVNPEDVLFAIATVPSTGAGGALVPFDGDCNSRVMNLMGSTASVAAVIVRESTRMRLKMPAAIPWWGIDTQSSAGSVDWLNSSPELPNAAYAFAVTDAVQQGTIQIQFEMPANNAASSAGMTGSARFFIGFIAFTELAGQPRVFTPIQTQPPGQGSTYQLAIGAKRGLRPIASTDF
jgi:hypothetical protein